MKSMGNRIIIWVVLFCVLPAVLAGSALAEKAKPKEDCNCNNNDGEVVAPEDKLINSEKIFSDIEQGGEKIKVIINLKKPDRSKRVMDWHSKSDINELQGQVKSRQNRVLKSLSKKEFKLDRQFKYLAAFAAEITPDCLNKLLDDPDVVSIEPVYTLYPHLAQGIPLMNAMLYRSNFNGQGVSIAICDTGVDYNHPMLGGGGFPNDKVIGGKDVAEDDNDPMPVGQAHGTACAGIAAGDFGSFGDYIGGVAYGAKIYALKISPDGSGGALSTDMIAAWEWCMDNQYANPNNPILVISTSFGGGRYTTPCNSSAMADMAEQVVAAGITILASSGNDGYCDSISSPACISSVISVGAVYDSAFGLHYPCISAESCADKTAGGGCPTNYYATDITDANKVTSYSNTATFLTILAPSNKAYTTDMVGADGYASGDYYSDFGGTSAACPYAAGAVAALQSASKFFKNKFLTPAEVKSLLISTGSLVTDGKTPITKPRINLGNAIESLDVNPCGTPEIGTGMSGWNFPLHTYYHDSRTQVIYLASEIGRAGFINSLALDVNVVPGQVMKNWTIRMKHTTLNAYSSYALDANGWTVVYQANEPAGATGWRTFTFTAAFEYDGTRNLMVDFSHNNTSYTTNGFCRYSTPGGNRSVIAYSDSLYGDPLNWSGTTSPATGCSTKVPNIRLNVCDQAGPNPPTMMDMNDVTYGACNTAHWQHVADANAYFAQCATDSYFASVVSDSNWISGTTYQYQFCGLSSDTYFYRVKARSPLGIEGGWSDIVSSRQCNGTIQGDFNDDCDVDFADLKTFTEQWCGGDSQPYGGEIPADLNNDNRVDFLDFAIFASHWMEGVEE